MDATPQLEPDDWQRLRSLLDQALALPPASRAAWLAALDEADPQLATLKPRLARLLSHAGEGTGTGRFEALPVLAPEPSEGQGAERALPPAVGPYRPVRLLGEGGMSTVWLACRDDLMLNRPVALKLPRGAGHHPGLAQRMMQEREILAVLDHPHIARLYDAGVTPDGQPWMALELVQGERIDDWCRARATPLPQRVQLFLQVIDAVAHAHAKLVVHRDLKPSNILVTPQGQVRLLDFGIAKLLGELPPGQADLTQGAARVMTPHYAAPEQMLAQPITTATDIHALGLVLYELLTGRRPYRPARDTAAALEQAVLHAEPQRPSAAALEAGDTRAARQLRGDLDTVLLKALKKRPQERYATADALAEDLRSWLAHQPVRARPDSARYRALKYLRRNRLPIGVVGLVVLCLAGGLAAALWQAQKARQEAAKATAIQDYLVGLFENNDIDQALRKRQQSVQQVLETSAETLATALPDQPQVREELQHLVGRLLHDLELSGPALAVRRERLRQLLAREAPAAERVKALRELAETEIQRGDHPAARATLGQVKPLCGSTGLAGTTDCLLVQVRLGEIEFAERRLQPALALIEPVAETLQRTAPGSLPLADALDTLGMLRSLQARPDDALAAMQQANEIRRTVWGADSVRYANARFRLGRLLWSERHLARAEAEFREALRIITAALGPEHVTTARVELNLGRLSLFLGLRDDGLARLQHASAVLQRHAARLEPSQLLEARFVLGEALLLDGRLREAGVELQQALDYRRTLGAEAQGDQGLDQAWGRWLIDTGQTARAREWLEAFRRRAVDTLGPDHPQVLDRSARLARAWLAEGRPAEAAREIEPRLAALGDVPGAFGSLRGRAELVLASAGLQQGHIQPACQVVERQREEAGRQPRENQARDSLFQLHELAGQCAARQGRPEEAVRHFEQVVALMRGASPQHPQVAAVRAQLAEVLARLGDGPQARQQWQLAAQALRERPEAGDQFRRPLREAGARLGLQPARAFTP